MPPRPQLWLGDYFQSIWHWKTRCKRYDAPPFDGRYIDTLEPGTIAGPITCVRHTAKFMTVQVEGLWINVWGTRLRADPIHREAHGSLYARPVRPPTLPSTTGLWNEHGVPIPDDPSMHDGPEEWTPTETQEEQHTHVSHGPGDAAAGASS